MSDATSRKAGDGDDAATKARGRREKELNEQAAEHQAGEKRAEQEAEANEQEGEPAEPTDPDQLRGEIAEAREELGDTVEALAAKADVKSRAKEAVEEQKDRAQAKLGQVTEQVKEKRGLFTAAAGGAITLILVVALLKRRR